MNSTLRNLVILSAVAAASAQSACQDEASCRSAAALLSDGGDFRVVTGTQTKGCFSKGGVYYWSPGGTEVQNSSRPTGKRSRVECPAEPAVPTTEAPEATIAVNADVELVTCLTAATCEARASDLGLFFAGPGPTAGCFSKGGSVYFGQGTVEEFENANLPGVQVRITCLAVTAEAVAETGSIVEPTAADESATVVVEDLEDSPAAAEPVTVIEEDLSAATEPVIAQDGEETPPSAAVPSEAEPTGAGSVEAESATAAEEGSPVASLPTIEEDPPAAAAPTIAQDGKPESCTEGVYACLTGPVSPFCASTIAAECDGVASQCLVDVKSGNLAEIEAVCAAAECLTSDRTEAQCRCEFVSAQCDEVGVGCDTKECCDFMGDDVGAMDICFQELVDPAAGEEIAFAVGPESAGEFGWDPIEDDGEAIAIEAMLVEEEGSMSYVEEQASSMSMSMPPSEVKEVTFVGEIDAENNPELADAIGGSGTDAPGFPIDATPPSSVDKSSRLDSKDGAVDGGLSSGAVAGIVIAAVFVVTLLALVVVMRIRNRNKRRKLEERQSARAAHAAAHVTTTDDASEMA